MNWDSVTKYRIRPCFCSYWGNFCGKWFIDDMNETPGIPGTFRSWEAALDAVIREQTRQYLRVTLPTDQYWSYWADNWLNSDGGPW